MNYEVIYYIMLLIIYTGMDSAEYFLEQLFDSSFSG